MVILNVKFVKKKVYKAVGKRVHGLCTPPGPGPGPARARPGAPKSGPRGPGRGLGARNLHLRLDFAQIQPKSRDFGPILREIEASRGVSRGVSGPLFWGHFD